MVSRPGQAGCSSFCGLLLPWLLLCFPLRLQTQWAVPVWSLVFGKETQENMSWACQDIKVQIKNLFQCLKNFWPKPSYGFKKKKKLPGLFNVCSWGWADLLSERKKSETKLFHKWTQVRRPLSYISKEGNLLNYFCTTGSLVLVLIFEFFPLPRACRVSWFFAAGAAG